MADSDRIPVEVPDIGSEADAIQFVGWLREVGDEVKEGDDLFEIETDKANMVCPAEASGRLAELVVEEQGEELEMGQTVGYLE